MRLGLAMKEGEDLTHLSTLILGPESKQGNTESKMKDFEAMFGPQAIIGSMYPSALQQWVLEPEWPDFMGEGYVSVYLDCFRDIILKYGPCTDTREP